MAGGTIRIVIDPAGSVTGGRRVKRELDEIRGAFNRTSTQAKKTQSSLSGLSRGMLGPLGIVAAGAAVAIEFRKVIQAGTEFQNKVQELSAITGATGKDLDALAAAARGIGQSTTKGAAEAAEGFKLIASAKPDLLENREALIAVTKEAVTLSEAAGLTLPEAAKALGGALNQFSLDADEASRVINVLAAGSQKGATEIPDLTESLRLSGTAASAMGISFEESIATIETLGEVNLKGAEAGVAFRNVLLVLKQQGIDELDPSVKGLVGSLENLASLQLKDAELIKLFGRETFTAVKALLQRTERTKELTGAISDTNTAQEQAEAATDTLDADLKKLNNTFDDLRIAIFQGANEPLREFIQIITASLKALANFSKEVSIFFDRSAAAEDSVSAASVEVLDRRIEQEKALLAKFEEADQGLQGTFARFRNDFSVQGFLGLTDSDTANAVQEQKQVVETLERIRTERQKAIDDLNKENTSPPPATTTPEGDIAANRRNSILAKLRGGGKGSKTTKTPEERAADRAAAEQARSFQNLRRELLPLVTAEEDLAVAQSVLTKEMELGNITEEERTALDAKLKKSFEDTLDPLGAVTRGLEEERAALGQTSEELAINQRVRDTVQSLQAQGLELTQEQTEALRDEVTELENARQHQADLAAVLQEIKGPQEDMNDRLMILRELLADGSIDLEQFRDKVDELRLATLEGNTDAESGFERGFIKATQNLNDFASLSEKVVTDSFQGMEDAIVQFAETGKVEFDGLVTQILQDLVRLQARQALAGFFGKPGEGGQGGSGLFGLLNSGSGSGGTEGANGSQSGQGFAQLAGIAGQVFASFGDGGIQQTPTISRIAEKGPEAIIPLAGGSVPVTLKNGGSQAPVINTTFNIQTPDPSAFNRSTGQIGRIMAEQLQSSIRRNG
jgi:TP901 family phage tail tape measure protein/lambda family phage tail tape measure protein